MVAAGPQEVRNLHRRFQKCLTSFTSVATPIGAKLELRDTGLFCSLVVNLKP